VTHTQKKKTREQNLATCLFKKKTFLPKKKEIKKIAFFAKKKRKKEIKCGLLYNPLLNTLDLVQR